MASFAAPVTVIRNGRAVIAHYGSVATELAVCAKHAGVVHRPELAVLELEGPAPWLESLLAQALDRPAPAVGSATPAGASWCARPAPGRATIVGPAGAIGGWRQVAQRSGVNGGHVRSHDAGGLTAFELIGPRAARVLAGAGVAATPPQTARTAALGAASAVVLCEAPGRFLVLVEAAEHQSALEALHAAGTPLGLARIGHDAFDRLVAAGRPAFVGV
jgi:glycine cleavage system aminomethyltransferase T